MRAPIADSKIALVYPVYRSPLCGVKVSSTPQCQGIEEYHVGDQGEDVLSFCVWIGKIGRGEESTIRKQEEWIKELKR